ncbi:MAG: PAS domain S-box protein, partial [Myxococcales bacterium]|nr:PAS domain S-box protein [Myxococcales bacterium]
PLADAALQRAAAGAERVDFEVRMPIADPQGDGQGWRWIDWCARSLPHEQGLYLVGRDVSERKRNEQEFQGLVESAPDASCVIDEQGTIVVVNAALERMFGYERAELLGGPVEILVPAALRARHRGHVAGFVSTPKPRSMGSGLDLQGQRKDGSIFRVEVSLSPVRTESRTLVACALRDIDARRREERVIKAILEAAPDGMIAVDARQQITHCNRRVEELFGYERAELIGQRLEVLIPEALRARHRGHMAAFIADPRARAMGGDRVLHGRRKDGGEIRVEISLSPVETEDGLLIACAIRGKVAASG